MNLNRLDDAIDQVAARLTQVDDDPALAARIVAALPQRRPLFWILQGWAPGLAAVVLAVTAFLVVRSVPTDTSGNPKKGLPPQVTSGRLAPQDSTRGLPQPETTRGLPQETAVGAAPSLGLPDDHRLNDRDHEFSLNALAAPEALSIGALTPDELPAEDALAIAPLAIPDLPLTADFSQR